MTFFKIQKSFKSLCFLALTFVLFSCASTPKKQQESPINEAETTLQENEEQKQALSENNSDNLSPTNNKTSKEQEGNENTQNSNDNQNLEDSKNQNKTEISEEQKTENEQDSSISESEKPENFDTEKILPEALPEIPYQDTTTNESVPEQNEDKKIYEPVNSLENEKEQLLIQDENQNSVENSSEQLEKEPSSYEEDKKNQSSEIETQETSQEKNDDKSFLFNEAEESSENTELPNEHESKKEIRPSRSVDMHRNQYINITYPGKGWIYQGNIDKDGNLDIRNKNFIFGGRKLGGKDQTFTLRSRMAGTFLLHFYKNDALTGEYIDDYLEVNVDNSLPESDEKIEAPLYANIVPPKATITAQTIKDNKKLIENTAKMSSLPDKNEANKNSEDSNKEISKTQNEDKKESSLKTVIQNSENKELPLKQEESINATAKKDEYSLKNSQAELEQIENTKLNAEQLLEKAKNEYNNKQYPQALESITIFFDKASSKLDEGLYLQGQILEQKSPVQNIKNAIESYDMVVKNYPSSRLWENANKRSIFLKRFYINIR